MFLNNLPLLLFHPEVMDVVWYQVLRACKLLPRPNIIAAKIRSTNNIKNPPGGHVTPYFKKFHK